MNLPSFFEEISLASLLLPLAFVLAIALYFWDSSRRAKAAKKAQAKHAATLASGKTEAYALYPKIDPNKCSGCGVCTRVCPEGDILQMIGGLPVLVSPTKCVGHTLCYRSCPVDAITMVFGTEKTGKQVPNYNENYETNVSGMYIAG